MFKRIITIFLLFIITTSSISFAQYTDYDTSYTENGLYQTTLSGMAAHRLYVYNILDSTNIKSHTYPSHIKTEMREKYPIIIFDDNEELKYQDVIKIFYNLIQFHSYSSETTMDIINMIETKYKEKIISNAIVFEEEFAIFLSKWLGYNNNSLEKAKELGFFDCLGKSNGFNKGDAYLMICAALDSPLANGEKIVRDVSKFRDEFLPPKILEITVTSYEDALAQVDKCLEYCAERIIIKYPEEVSLKTRESIFRYFCFQEYCWDDGLEQFFPYAGYFRVSSGSNLIVSHPETGFRVSHTAEAFKNYPEHQEKYAKIEEKEKNGEFSEIEADFLKQMVIYDLCENKDTITLYARGKYEHKYLNLDIENDWLYCYSNEEYTSMVQKFAEEKLDPLKDLSDYEKVQKIQQIICNNCRYNYTEERRITYGSKIEDDDSCNRSHDISGFFLYKTIVCDGYAYVFSWMADYLDIESVIIIGGVTYSDVGHAWNKVKVNNNWYNIDVCWADTGSGPNTYFLKSDKFFQQHQHVFEDDEYLLMAPKNYPIF